MCDIEMCKDKRCPQRKDCYRFTATPNPFGQWYGGYKYNFGCDMFCDNNVQKTTKDKQHEINIQDKG